MRGTLAATALLAACAHEKPSAERLFVAGTIYECGAAPLHKYAVGKTVRLVAGNDVLAEDVVGPDGTIVLHPRDDRYVEGAIYVEAGSNRMSLTNDYASWMQEHIHNRVTMTYGCGPAPAAAAGQKTAAQEPEEEAPVRRPPPSNLVPHY
jgi:hypothetical protein